MKEQKFPPGWDEKRVKALIDHYEDQTEDEEFAEIEAALQDEGSYPYGDSDRTCSESPGAARRQTNWVMPFCDNGNAIGRTAPCSVRLRGL